MKICSPQLGMDPNSQLGGEIHDYFILQNLAQLSNKIYVLLPKNKPYQKERNILVERAPIEHIFAPMFNMIAFPFMFNTLKKQKYDILRIHSPYFLGFAAFLFKLFNPKVPTIATFHLREDNPLMLLFVKLTIKKYDAIIAVSEYVKNWLVTTFKVSRSKIKVIYNGVSPNLKPTKKNSQLLNKYNLENKVVILFVGLLIERKNPIFLLKVFKSIKQRKKNIALILCGEGPLRNQIKDYIKVHNIKDVVLTGAIHGQQKVDFFNLCDIFALPSINEGFGLVVAEAMACKKAVIASKNSSLPELIRDQEDGVLVNTDDEKDWSEKLEELILDEGLRKKLAGNAYKKAKRLFSWKKAALAHQKLFEELINA